MQKLNLFDSFLSDLYFILTNRIGTESQLKIFRVPNNKLESNGDLSFSVKQRAWTNVFNTFEEHEKKLFLRIFESLDFQDLILRTHLWNIPISKFIVKDEKLIIFLNRIKTYGNVLNCVITQKDKYGTQPFDFNTNIELRTEHSSNKLSEMDLTQLRIKLVKDVIENLLNLNTSTTTKEVNSKILYMTNRSNSDLEDKKILVGVVTSNKFGKKNSEVTAKEYYDKHTMDSRLMAQHKYGMRVNSETGWADIFQTLGSAAVTIDLLHVKLNRPLVDNIHTSESSHKGSSAILYNCARLNELFKKFDKKVEEKKYPQLPPITDVDFSLLNQPEEWHLLYVYLLQYPQMIRSCIQDINNCKLNTHNLCVFLDSFCSLFSVYYRRVRVLTEPRTHMLPVLFSRIYLLKGVQQVLHNALAILNISPVKTM